MSLYYTYTKPHRDLTRSTRLLGPDHKNPRGVFDAPVFCSEVLMVFGSRNRLRVLVFVDYSNFRPSMDRAEPGFRIDLRPLGRSLAEAAREVVEPEFELVYQGLRLYGSYDPDSQAGESQRKWYEVTASGTPGVTPVVVPRQRKRNGPMCPSCHVEASRCASCDSSMRGTEEKGVDTRMATDLISTAWDSAYDVAVLVSSDRDFIPVVNFLETRVVKVIHGAFPPAAADLSRACWAHIDIPSLREHFRR